MTKPLIRERIVISWFLSGLEDFFYAFKIHSPWRYEPFLCSIGFEKISKAYILALNAAKYENLKWHDAKEMVNCLAKKRGHHLKKMVKEIKNHVNDPDPESILNNSSAKLKDNHKTTLEAMEAAYLECRYPVPSYFHEKFPVASILVNGHPVVYDDPIGSTNFVNFCASFAGKISKYLKKNFDISISRKRFDSVVNGNASDGFCNRYLQYFTLNDST
ncbi:hypothetical protein CEE37_02470 [candidate division LCP-89 bacterium B3_LCP]|uniref:HEPN domain-containing protein n=1 Tax=candidate division LCP-89 bacterium B3_LCP TaxID=2012998 RepID=A0A532V5U2_UNCL8|nr:MAG: hypothetical protein CEE37_02470 [candidate division LCP-89 bacterium B3_LCP]